MREHGIQGAKRRGKPWRTTIARPEHAARRPDLVDATSAPARPDGSGSRDFTYLRCWEGVVFFAFVIDAYSRRIVGWQFAAHMRAALVCDALRMALCTRARHGADVELVHHSDERQSRVDSTGRRNTSSVEVLRWAGRRGGWGDHGAVGDEVAGAAVVAPRGAAGVLA